jgi:hypothetical protein
MAVATMTDNPAAGPDTLTEDPLRNPTIIPPIMPANNPAAKGALEAIAMPKHKGNATRKTTRED